MHLSHEKDYEGIVCFSNLEVILRGRLYGPSRKLHSLEYRELLRKGEYAYLFSTYRYLEIPREDLREGVSGDFIQ